MRLRGIVISACLLAWPALVSAQGYADPQGERSVIRPAGYGWRNYVAVPDGPCGYDMPVRADCYDVCRPCGLRPLCFLGRVARTLDCLLPCNLCHHGGGYGGGPLHGCVLGRQWGCNSCSGGCCTNPAGSVFDDVCCSHGPSCGYPSCTSTVPALSDPFQDDPLPPKPMPNPAREVRRMPAASRPSMPAPSRSVMPAPSRSIMPAPSRSVMPTPSRSVMPAPSRSVMTPPQRTAAARPTSASAPRPTTTSAPRPTSPYKITTTPARSSAGATNQLRSSSPQSTLRQTSHDRELAEPAPHWIDQAHARPLIRSQSPPETPADLEIPYNPLRAR
jgi:hypothetical protein